MQARSPSIFDALNPGKWFKPILHFARGYVANGVYGLTPCPAMIAKTRA